MRRVATHHCNASRLHSPGVHIAILVHTTAYMRRVATHHCNANRLHSPGVHIAVLAHTPCTLGCCVLPYCQKASMPNCRRHVSCAHVAEVQAWLYRHHTPVCTGHCEQGSYTCVAGAVHCCTLWTGNAVPADCSCASFAQTTSSYCMSLAYMLLCFSEEVLIACKKTTLHLTQCMLKCSCSHGFCWNQMCNSLHVISIIRHA